MHSDARMRAIRHLALASAGAQPLVLIIASQSHAGVQISIFRWDMGPSRTGRSVARLVEHFLPDLPMLDEPQVPTVPLAMFAGALRGGAPGAHYRQVTCGERMNDEPPLASDRPCLVAIPGDVNADSIGRPAGFRSGRR